MARQLLLHGTSLTPLNQSVGEMVRYHGGAGRIVITYCLGSVRLAVPRRKPIVGMCKKMLIEVSVLTLWVVG